MNTYTPEQQAEHRAIFVDALESGRYRQCSGALTKPADLDSGITYETHCCLGVATEEAMVAGVNLQRVDYGVDLTEYRWTNERTNRASMVDLLPEPVRHWLGFATTDGALRTAIDYRADGRIYKARSLTDLNDDAGYSFEQIAEQIKNDNVVLEGEPVDD